MKLASLNILSRGDVMNSSGNLTTFSPGQRRNFIFLILLAVILIGLLTCGTEIERKNAVLLQDSWKYKQVQQLMQQGKPLEASRLQADLLNRHAYSYQLLWTYGLSMAAQGEWQPAGKYMEQARKVRPALVSEQIFLVQYGEVLYNLGDYDRASLYLQESLKYNKQAELIPIAQKLLQQIEAAKVGR